MTVAVRALDEHWPARPNQIAALCFQFAVLEIADSKTGAEETLAQESHWKEVLASRAHGYNAN